MHNLSLWERFRLASRILVEGKTAYEFTHTWDAGQPKYPAANYRNNVIEGYRRNELIYACITKKADSAAGPTLRVYRRRDGLELPDHPCRRVIQRPNPYMTEFDWVSITMMMLDLAGISYWEKVRSRAGRVVELWPLRPDYMHPVIGSTGLPTSYIYNTGSEQIPLADTDVLAFRLWDPLDMYRGLAPVAVAARIGDVDSAVTDYLKKFFEQGGVPAGLLSSKLKLTDPAVADIRRRWRERYGGWRNWMEPAVLDSDAQYQRMALSFQEMGFEILDARDETRICTVLRVPADTGWGAGWYAARDVLNYEAGAAGVGGKTT